MVDIAVIICMLIPFAFHSIYAYFYWIALTGLYLAYKAWRWKV
ncbi:hypothetical protein Arcpr_0082 [Archaeoglobus profundus DSM 5631]|uniref:Uncharacterized protein n=1 Tax=Archaeoglobus profundus (strain DSM 5631 / JCM 9629 / NBRC 100127 / Av18) TaxID=572546 RepID=D2RFT3_ARCPA|nr:hypothetical protein Arcpr_0082 [Archaeoglobus profundus DSM 5631]